ncbi:hypothetical protein Mgra_00007120 [Meloidogyne graminicola]|uniref:L domain-like protein n=1 Tax=Meloidogyne graminicola TaxID=189291 RepID=A0A8S9ZJ42_9BILA|nr:hypothetical protein Mgra_00007120 [Meloidogyne graminicola]
MEQTNSSLNLNVFDEQREEQSSSSVDLDVDLSQRYVENIPLTPFVGENSPYREYDRIASLNLSTNLFVHFPLLICQFKNLIRLDISNNQLTSLPKEFSSLRRLTYLSLRANSITNIPAAIAKLKNLNILYIGGNRLISIPDSIGALSELTCLGLAENCLESIPASIANLHKLRTLFLHNNRIKVLPPGIARLKNLEQLSLRNNPLVTDFVNEILLEPPTLKELAARIVKIRFSINIYKHLIPLELLINVSSKCSTIEPAYAYTSSSSSSSESDDDQQRPMSSTSTYVREKMKKMSNSETIIKEFKTKALMGFLSTSIAVIVLASLQFGYVNSKSGVVGLGDYNLKEDGKVEFLHHPKIIKDEGNLEAYKALYGEKACNIYFNRDGNIALRYTHSEFKQGKGCTIDLLTSQRDNINFDVGMITGEYKLYKCLNEINNYSTSIYNNIPFMYRLTQKEFNELDLNSHENITECNGGNDCNDIRCKQNEIIWNFGEAVKTFVTFVNYGLTEVTKNSVPVSATMEEVYSPITIKGIDENVATKCPKPEESNWEIDGINLDSEKKYLLVFHLLPQSTGRLNDNIEKDECENFVIFLLICNFNILFPHLPSQKTHKTMYSLILKGEPPPPTLAPSLTTVKNTQPQSINTKISTKIPIKPPTKKKEEGSSKIIWVIIIILIILVIVAVGAEGEGGEGDKEKGKEGEDQKKDNNNKPDEVKEQTNNAEGEMTGLKTEIKKDDKEGKKKEREEKGGGENEKEDNEKTEENTKEKTEEKTEEHVKENKNEEKTSVKSEVEGSGKSKKESSALSGKDSPASPSLIDSPVIEKKETDVYSDA